MSDDRRDTTLEALAGLVGWAQLILADDDMPADLRARFADNHRLTTAVLTLAAPPTTAKLTDRSPPEKE